MVIGTVKPVAVLVLAPNVGVNAAASDDGDIEMPGTFSKTTADVRCTFVIVKVTLLVPPAL